MSAKRPARSRSPGLSRFARLNTLYRLRHGAWGRIGKMLVAVLAGWLAGYVVTLPTEIVQVTRIAGPDRRMVLSSLLYGLPFWGLVTGFMAAVAMVFFLGPVATLVRPNWLLRHQVIGVLAFPVLSQAAVSYKLYAWYEFDPEPFYVKPLFLAYGLFTAMFSVVVGLVYTAQLRRAERRLRPQGQP